MSSERGGRNPSADCSRFPGEGSSSPGKSGPKARPKGVVDGQRVDIPVPRVSRSGRYFVAKTAFGLLTHEVKVSDAVTEKGSSSQAMVVLGQVRRGVSR